ncbi:hypothetical protein Trydic_g10237 [Trypoxylus dichotomus]
MFWESLKSLALKPTWATNLLIICSRTLAIILNEKELKQLKMIIEMLEECDKYRRVEQFDGVINACKVKHKTGGLLVIVYHPTEDLTSSTTALGTQEHAIAGTSTSSNTYDDLEEVIYGQIIPDRTIGPILQSISTFRQEDTYISTSEGKPTKYSVLMRVISNNWVKKLPKKDHWKGRVKEMIRNIPDQ